MHCEDCCSTPTFTASGQLKNNPNRKNEDRAEDHEKEDWEREMLKTTFVHGGLRWRETGSNGGGNSQMHRVNVNVLCTGIPIRNNVLENHNQKQCIRLAMSIQEMQ